MKVLEAVENNFYVTPMQKQLACRGSSNSEIVCFKLNRYVGETDLAECHCTIKTKNSEGQSDLVVPEVTADEKKLYINWTLSSGVTAAAGPLQVQVQLEKIFDDSSKNVNWQSKIMEFQITDSLDAADEIEDQDPTLFQQWEENVNTLYSDAAADVQSMQALQAEVKADADSVTQQKQSVEQTAAQVTQDAQAASDSTQNALASSAAAQNSAVQAQTSASDANTAQGLAKGYSDAAKTYSDAASISAQSAQNSVQSAQQQADAAQVSAIQAQQKVDSFSGYTKGEIDNGFANALMGEASGNPITLNDALPQTDLLSLVITGSTSETGSGTKEPDNPYILAGLATPSISFSEQLGNSQNYSVLQTLFGLPDGTADTFDLVSGEMIQRVEKVVIDGSGTWTNQENNGSRFWAGIPLQNMGGLPANTPTDLTLVANMMCDKMPVKSANAVYACKGYSIGLHPNGSALITVPLSVADTLSELKVWLAQNPITVLYAIKSPMKQQTQPQCIPICGANAEISADKGILNAVYRRDINAAYREIIGKIEALAGA